MLIPDNCLLSLARRVRHRLALALLLLTLAACGGGGAAPPPERLRFVQVSISNSRPAIGETVFISWIVATNSSSNFLGLRLRTLEVGLLSVCDTVRDSDSEPNLLQTETFSFRMEGPVTIEVACFDERSGSIGDDKPADSIAFDVLPERTGFFRCELRTQSDPDFPALGGLGAVSSGAVFHQFVACFDPQDAVDGSIKALDPVASRFPADRPFFGRSTSEQETNGFGFELGSGYPKSCLSGGPDANACVLASTIRYEGGFTTVLDVKLDAPIDAVRKPQAFEHVFVALPMAVLGFETSNVVPVDVQIGNVAQGLVLQSFCTNAPGGSLRDARLFIRGTSGFGDGTIDGTIKDVIVVGSITKFNGQSSQCLVTASIAFDMPISRDDSPALVARFLFPRGVSIDPCE